MSDENQMTKEERANQELIRTSELRMTQFVDSAASFDKKAILLMTACLIVVGFLITEFVTADKISNAFINFILHCVQFVLILSFAHAMRIAANVIASTGFCFSKWENVITGHLSLQPPILQTQEIILRAYEQAMPVVRDENDRKAKLFGRAGSVFIKASFGAIVFLFVVKIGPLFITLACESCK